MAFVDRFASHRNNPSAGKYNKMAIPIFEHPSRPAFFEPHRQKVLRRYAVPSRQLSCPKIAYIDRQDTSRNMSEPLHDEFLRMLLDIEDEGLGFVERLWMEDLEVVEQLRQVADATVSRMGPEERTYMRAQDRDSS